ncbi:hypothetical protein ACHAXT_009759 [Thalassiosira profunda]
MRSYRHASSPRGGAAASESAMSSASSSLRHDAHLKSCLRHGAYSRGSGPGSGAASSLSPSQGTLQLHYQRQERRRHACQAREEEECSARSAPTHRYSTSSGYSGSHPSLAASSCSASTARSAASEPTATRTNYGGGHYCNTYEHHHHTDRRRGREEALAPMDSERHFMRVSKLLVTEHMATGSTHPSVARRMLSEHLSTYEERRTFYQGLKRNVGYLPMFPEPNEHPSLAMTRYVDKMFGPVLAQEVGKGGYGGGGGGSGSAYDVSPRYPQQHFLQDRDEQRSARDYLQHSKVSGSNQSYNQNVVSSMTDQPIFGPPSSGPASTVDYRVPPPGPVPIPIQRQRPTFDDVWNSDDAPAPAGDSKPIHPNVIAPSEMIPSWAQVSTPKETEEDAASKGGEELTSPVAHVTFSPSTGLSCSSAKETGAGQKQRHHGSNSSVEQSTVSGRSLFGNSTSSSLEVNSEEMSDSLDSSGKARTDGNDDSHTTNSASIKSRRRQKYQKFSTEDMMSPLTPREKILYYPKSHRKGCGSPSPCCNRGKLQCYGTDSHLSRRPRPPEYLQLYVKCERSEPFANENLDIETWYRDGANRVTADRTLVAKNTASAYELIRAIVESFGLTSPPEEDLVEGGTQDGLGCFNDICFVSDIKTTTCQESAQTHLTPLPIPGLYYKYVDRDGDSRKSNKGSSVLSTEPEGLKRTLVAQLLDKPIYPRSPSLSNANRVGEGGLRTRLALVYCAPKRQSCVSLRSTHTGTLPATIYHFQILLEGIVPEDELPSSFGSQASVRCVGATGGVLGGSVVDKRAEIDEVNRALWTLEGGGQRDVIGLAIPGSNQRDNLDRIIDALGTPLFDTKGNQLPKEFVVDRCLYNLCSGKLSMEAAQKTTDAAVAIEGTTDWLAQRMEEFVGGLADGVGACAEDQNVAPSTCDRGLDEFDYAVSRFGAGGGTQQSQSWI